MAGMPTLGSARLSGQRVAEALGFMKGQRGSPFEKNGSEFRLERLEVGYKSASNLKFTDGKHEHTSKKDFCRLLKGATLISPLPPEKPSTPPARTA